MWVPGLPSAPESESLRSPVAASHSSTDVPRPPVASTAPSGEYATLRTRFNPSKPGRRDLLPMSTTAGSAPITARLLPSGEKDR